jgi:heme O synthase-like polyprenyltransferase
MIERQIILASEKTVSMVLFRGVIALIMAIVGSTIFDQTMFGKDIDKQMSNTIEKQVAELTPQRVHIIDEKLLALHTDIDSLTRVNE